jgi:hypothetical protein
MKHMAENASEIQIRQQMSLRIKWSKVDTMARSLDYSDDGTFSSNFSLTW